jgi:hypothetical protein
MKSRKVALVVTLTLAFLQIFNPVPASADITDRINSASDVSNNSQVNSSYDLVSIETGLESTDPNILYIWLKFKNKITANQFVGTKPWAAVLIYREEPTALGGNTDDIRIRTNSNSPYSGNSTISAIAEGNSYAGDPRGSLSSCNPKTWTNLDQAVTWIGFSIDRTCAEIPGEFWVTGFVDPDQLGSSTYPDFDYAPDIAMDVDYTSQWDENFNENYDPFSGDMQDQEIIIEVPGPVSVAKKSVWFNVEADSGLPVYVISNTPKICKTGGSPGAFYLLSGGVCNFTVYQDGDDSYNPAEQEAAFVVLPAKTVTKSKPTTKKSVTPKVSTVPKAPPIVPKK